MTAGQMTVSAAFLAAALFPLTGCEKQQATDSPNKEPEFKSASEDLPDCCMPSDDTVSRTSTAESNDAMPADSTTLLATNSPELVAKVGSIQTSVDPSMVSTLIGNKPNLDLTFKNEDGQDVNLARDYADKTIVLSTIFTSCPTPTACPRITDDFADMANRLPADLADKVRFVLVSFDPQNDTPQVLKIWGRKHNVNFDRVDLLVSDVATTKELILEQLGIPMELDEATGAFSNHALMVHVINPDGYLVVERTATSSAKISMVLDEAIRAAKLPFVAPDNGG